ncbi:MAG: aspartyl/asparaginyl beta-hydroxylase domain-containing protein [Rhizomicrobium sp.]
MEIPDRLPLPFKFDPALLLRDLENLASVDWIAHFVTQNYDGDWSVIPLRSPVGARHPVMMIYSDPTAKRFEDTPMLGICPYFRKVLGTFACEVLSARLMRLAPGSLIKEHRDHDLSVERGTVRIHIPIATNPGVEFELNRSRVVMKPGSAWYLRLSDPHRVANNGATDRVHMVVDLIVNEWIREILQQAVRRQSP